jgi:hypothetical protein
MVFSQEYPGWFAITMPGGTGILVLINTEGNQLDDIIGSDGGRSIASPEREKVGPPMTKNGLLKNTFIISGGYY